MRRAAAAALVSLLRGGMARDTSTQPWVCPKPNIYETNCTELDNVNEQADWGLFFAEHPRYDCDLAIINAGMPRTGSTLLQELAVEAVSLLGKTFPSQRRLSFVNGEYWRFNRHLNNHSSDWSGPTVPEHTDIVYFKSHNWDSELHSICQRNLVLLTDRDPTAMIASLIKVRARLYPDESKGGDACDWAYELLLKYRGMHFCWKEHAQVPFRVSYEHMRNSKVAVAAAIATLLASMFDFVTEVHDQPTTISYTFPADYHAAEANPSLPGLTNLSKDAYNAAKAQEIRDSLPDACQDPQVWAHCFKSAY